MNELSEETKNDQELNEEQPKVDNEETVEEVFAEEAPQEDQATDELSELQAKLDESENRYLRLRADFDNFRRRINAEMKRRKSIARRH